MFQAQSIAQVAPGYLLDVNGRVVSESRAASLIADQLRDRVTATGQATIEPSWQLDGRPVWWPTIVELIQAELLKGTAPVGFSARYLVNIQRLLRIMRLLHQD